MAVPEQRPRRRRTAKPGPATVTESSVRKDLVASEIYEHATQLFASRGYAGTSLQDIADAVGLTRPALYYYFKSKEDLLANLVAEITQESAESMGAIAGQVDLDPAAKLHAIVKSGVRRQAEYSARFRLLILSESDLPTDLAARHERGRRSVLKAVAQVIDEGIRTGVFRNVEPRVAALGLLGMTNWVAWWYQPGTASSVDDIAEELAGMAVASLVRPDGAQVSGPSSVLEQMRRNLDDLERMI